MFTSGTTGNPKGVIIPHKSVVAAVAGVDHVVGPMFSAQNDLYIAYLPLAHIMELVAEIAQVKVGIPMGFGTPHTLTNTGVKLAAGCPGDMTILKPTVVVFAPLVLEKIYNGIQAKVAAGGAVAQWLFQNALASGLASFERGDVGAPFLWNLLVFKKIQEMTGGRVRLVLTGSAPLDGNVHKFVQTCLNCPVRQGYGATETCAASCVQEVLDNSVCCVGPPRVTACIKLIDWEEGNYRFTDSENPAIGMPRGEIVIGGEGVCLGYLVDPEHPDPEIVSKNESDFKTDENGVRWFYTGDIGQVTRDGSIQIIDRKKDLVKLQHGEYVALSKVEGVLKLSNFVENAMVHADSRQTYCVALVCPQFATLNRFIREKGLGDDADAACEHPDVIAEVLRTFREVSKGKLQEFEIPKKVILVPSTRTWTPENDLLTAAMKLKRKPIINAHEEEIAKLYVSA
jgi:long-subunit acyl-CoA synthetase (AMP-forming)